MENAKDNTKSKILLIALIIAGCILAFIIFVPQFAYADELEDVKNNWFVKTLMALLVHGKTAYLI